MAIRGIACNAGPHGQGTGSPAGMLAAQSVFVVVSHTKAGTLWQVPSPSMNTNGSSAQRVALEASSAADASGGLPPSAAGSGLHATAGTPKEVVQANGFGGAAQ